MKNVYDTIMLSEVIAKLTAIKRAHGDIPVVAHDIDAPKFPDPIPNIGLSVVECVNHPRYHSYATVSEFDRIAEPLRTELKALKDDAKFMVLEVTL